MINIGAYWKLKPFTNVIANNIVDVLYDQGLSKKVDWKVVRMIVLEKFEIK